MLVFIVLLSGKPVTSQYQIEFWILLEHGRTMVTFVVLWHSDYQCKRHGCQCRSVIPLYIFTSWMPFLKTTQSDWHLLRICPVSIPYLSTY